MKALDIARQVVNEKQCVLFRPRLESPGAYDVKPAFDGKKRGWTYLDLTTASAICNVHDALNDANKVKFAALPLVKMATVAFKLLK